MFSDACPCHSLRWPSLINVTTVCHRFLFVNFMLGASHLPPGKIVPGDDLEGVLGLVPGKFVPGAKFHPGPGLQVLLLFWGRLAMMQV